MEALLDKGLLELGISLSAAQQKQLETYWSELALWNGKYGLVNASGEALVIKHFLDSFSAVPLLKTMTFDTACDVGSGGGFPGLVLAVAFPDKKFTLIERSGKKYLGLRKSIKTKSHQLLQKSSITQLLCRFLQLRRLL